MSKKIYTLLLLFSVIFFLPTNSDAQEQEGVLLGNWQNDNLPEAFFGRYNEVWGIVVNGVEYGVIGSTMGVHFIGLEPDINGNLPEIAFVEGGATGTSLIHRDYHSFGDYLYTVADEGSTSTLQIIDFSNLPTSVSVVYDSNEFITRSHNIFIDEDNARLYSSEGTVLSLADPTQPTLLDNGPFFAHDIFARDNILYVNNGNSGMLVYDYTDASNPQVIGSLTSYINSGYNHAGWLSEDGSHYFLCDETGGSFVKSINVTDIADMEVVDMFKADNDNPNHIAHNAMVLGNKLYVSYYSDGLAIFDITDPTRVVRKYYYDTYPGIDDSGFKGAWGVYSFLPSGRILVSDLNTGFYLIQIPEDQSIFALDEEVIGCANTDLVFDVLVGSDFDAAGATLSLGGLPSGATASFSQNPAMPNAIVEVTISGIDAAVNFDLQLVADDGTANASNMVPVEVLPAAQAVVLNMPEDASVGVDFAPTFSWDAIGPDKLLEISTFADFSTVDVLSQMVFTNSYVPQTDLDPNVTYYWRLSYESDCGDIVSDVYSFTTAIVDGIEDVIASTVSISPNPVQSEMIIETGEYFQGEVQVQLFDVDGKTINVWNVFNANEKFILDAPTHLEGLFLLQMSNNKNTVTKKIVFAK